MKSSKVTAITAAAIVGVGLLAGCTGTPNPPGDRRRQGVHHRRPRPAWCHSGRAQRARRSGHRLRGGDPGHHREADRVPVDRHDLRRGARGRHAARRVQRAVHRLEDARERRPARRHHRRVQPDRDGLEVEQERPRRRHRRRRAHLRHSVGPVRDGALVQPRHVHEGRPRPRQAADDLRRDRGGREDPRREVPGRRGLHADDLGQHGRMEPHDRHIRPRRPHGDGRCRRQDHGEHRQRSDEGRSPVPAEAPLAGQLDGEQLHLRLERTSTRRSRRARSRCT